MTDTELRGGDEVLQIRIQGTNETSLEVWQLQEMIGFDDPEFRDVIDMEFWDRDLMQRTRRVVNVDALVPIAHFLRQGPELTEPGDERLVSLDDVRMAMSLRSFSAHPKGQLWFTIYLPRAYAADPTHSPTWEMLVQVSELDRLADWFEDLTAALFADDLR